MHTFVGVRDVARHLRRADRIVEIAEWLRIIVTGLLFQARVIDRSSVESWRRSGFESIQRETHSIQSAAESRRGSFSRASSGGLRFARVHDRLQERSGRQDHRRCVVDRIPANSDTDDSLVGQAVLSIGDRFRDQVLNGFLPEVQIVLGFDPILDEVLVGLFVRLSTRAVHRGAFAAVKHPKLDSGCVDRFAHQAAQCVDFANDLAFCHAADRWVAGHLSDRIQVGRQQGGFRTQACCSGGGFRSRVTGSDNDNIVVVAILRIVSGQWLKSTVGKRRCSKHGLSMRDDARVDAKRIHANPNFDQTMRFDQHQSRLIRRSTAIRRALVAAMVTAGLAGGTVADSRATSAQEVADVIMKSDSFQIPFNIATAGTAPVEVQLYVAVPANQPNPADQTETSRENGSATQSGPLPQQNPYTQVGARTSATAAPGQWKLLDRQPPDARQFHIRESGEGTFWFATRTVDANGRPFPPGPIVPELKVVVDTQGPQIDLEADSDADGRVVAKFTIRDATETRQLTVHYVTDTTRRWQVATVEREGNTGRLQLHPKDDWKQLSLRLRALDQAGNETIVSELVQKPRVASKPTTRFASGPNGYGPSFGQGIFQGFGDLPGQMPAGGSEAASQGPEMLPLPSGMMSEPAGPVAGNAPGEQPHQSAMGAARGIESIATPEAESLPAPSRPQTPAEAMRPLDAPAPQTQGPSPAMATPQLPGPQAQSPALQTPASQTPPAQSPTLGTANGSSSAEPETPFHVGPSLPESIPAPAGLNTNAPSQLNAPEPTPPVDKIQDSKEPVQSPWSPITGDRKSRDPLSLGRSTDTPTEMRYESQRASSATMERTTLDPRETLDLKRLAERSVIRHSDSNRFSLDFEIEAIGGRGVEAIELYGTTDGGITWNRWGTDPDKASPFDIETKGEGIFGFQIVVVAANGLTSPRPLSGDAPDIVVVVDQTEPEVSITGARYGEADRAGSLVIAYRCQDQYLMSRPITLSFSDTPEGPWTTIAAGLRNLGDYVWPADPQLPRQIYLRIDATDQAGNVGSYVLDQPVDTRGLAPRARIRAFRSISSR